jgi:UDP-glucose 4-epimerase
MKVLVTGATGFVGQALVKQLATKSRWQVRGAVRRVPADPVAGCQYVQVGDLGTAALPEDLMRDCGTVVHTAARVHVTREASADPLAEFRRVNVEGTRALAQAARRAGVQRFVFLSSVKAMGETSPPGRPWTEDDPPAPVDPYGISKLEAEAALREVCRGGSMEFVIVRPPLVYGPGAGANFAALAKAVRRRLPLPLARVDNRRSLVALPNLLAFLELCMTQALAANQVFFVSDGAPLSTPAIVRALAAGAGKSPRLFGVPRPFVDAALTLAGRRGAAQRLYGDLAVDTTRAVRLLGWSPPVDAMTALAAAAKEIA